MTYIRSNEDRERKNTQQAESIFAREVLARVGGSCVYIAPKKSGKFIYSDKVE